jgi:hypothetical protein
VQLLTFALLALAVFQTLLLQRATKQTIKLEPLAA